MFSVPTDTLIISGALLTLAVFALCAVTWVMGYGAGERDLAKEKDARIGLMMAEQAKLKADLCASNDSEESAWTEVSRLGEKLAAERGKLAFANAKLEAWADPKASKTIRTIVYGGPYIVLPTLAFAVLPADLRNRLTAMLQEAEDMGVNWPTGYNVVRRGEKGRAAKDAWNVGTGLLPGTLSSNAAFHVANARPLKDGAGDQP